MKPLMFGSLCAALLTAAPAFAVETVSGQVIVGFNRNSDESDNSKRFLAQTAFGLGGAWALQFDVGVGKFEDTYSAAPYGAMHLTYDLSPEWTVGAFLAGEDTRPGNYFYYGVEAAYDDGTLAAEAYLAGIDVIKSSASGTRYGFDMTYDLAAYDPMIVLAGAHGQTLRGDNRSYGYVGAGYAFDNDVQIALTVGMTDRNETISGLTFTIPFGGGTDFGSRDTRSLFPAYPRP